jgi:hypothetical protein
MLISIGERANTPFSRRVTRAADFDVKRINDNDNG